jgi:hypothetical protein
MLALIFSKTNKTLTAVNELQITTDKVLEKTNNDEIVESIVEIPIEPIGQIDRPTKRSKPKDWLMKLKNMKFPKNKK